MWLPKIAFWISKGILWKGQSILIEKQSFVESDIFWDILYVQPFLYKSRVLLSNRAKNVPELCVLKIINYYVMNDVFWIIRKLNDANIYTNSHLSGTIFILELQKKNWDVQILHFTLVFYIFVGYDQGQS